MHAPFAVRDYSLRRTKPLPAAASSATTTDSIAIPKHKHSHFLANCEVEVVAPTLSTTILPDTRTATYDLIQSDAADLSNPSVLQAGVILQTGAGGAGASGVTKKLRLPTDVKPFIGLRCTFGASTTTGAAHSMVLDLLF